MDVGMLLLNSKQSILNMAYNIKRLPRFFIELSRTETVCLLNKRTAIIIAILYFYSLKTGKTSFKIIG